MISWFFAEANDLHEARDRRIVAWSGLAPDVDVVAYLAGLVYYRLDKELAFEHVWKVVHHRYTHNMAFVLATGVVAWLLASRAGGARLRWRVALLAMAASALHNFCDVVAGGPTWPIYPLWPASELAFSASWSWTIGEWPNVLILVAGLAGTLAYARAAGRSPLECFGTRADQWMVRIVREGSDGRPADAAALGASRRRRVIIWTTLLVAVAAILAPLLVSAGPTVPATRVVASIDGAPALGHDKAPVTIVEYTDFECPFCRRFHMTTWEALKRKYIDTGKVRYVSRDFPLPSHPRALPAARIARCAAEQGRFWEMRHALFAEGVPADDRHLVELGFAQGLDPGKLGACMSNPKLDAGLKSDIEEARFLGVGGTPTFIFGRARGFTVEGEIVGGAMPLAELESRIDALLAVKR